MHSYRKYFGTSVTAIPPHTICPYVCDLYIPIPICIQYLDMMFLYAWHHSLFQKHLPVLPTLGRWERWQTKFTQDISLMGKDLGNSLEIWPELEDQDTFTVKSLMYCVVWIWYDMVGVDNYSSSLHEKLIKWFKFIGIPTKNVNIQVLITGRDNPIYICDLLGCWKHQLLWTSRRFGITRVAFSHTWRVLRGDLAKNKGLVKEVA